MISSVTRQPAARKVIVGVDTHKHVHVAVAVDILGTRLGDQSFVADSGGYQALITWAEIHGPIRGVRHRRYRELWCRPGRHGAPSGASGHRSESG